MISFNINKMQWEESVKGEEIYKEATAFKHPHSIRATSAQSVCKSSTIPNYKRAFILLAANGIIVIATQRRDKSGNSAAFILEKYESKSPVYVSSYLNLNIAWNKPP